MRVMRRLRGLLAALVLIGGSFLCRVDGVLGQSNAPSAQELQIFQGLPPEQQQAIMEQLGNRGSDQTTGAGSLGNGQGLDQSGRMRPGLGQSDQKGMNRDQKKSEEDEEDQQEPMIPVLRRQDWVIIEIDYQLAPRPVPPYLQSVYSAQNGQAAAAAAAAADAQKAQAPAPTAPNSPAGTGNASPMTAFQAGLSDEQRTRMDALMDLIRAKNPYRLGNDGALNLPGFAPIALLGLSEEQATLRLKVEPAFRGIDIRLTRLPLKKTGSEGLKPFGYALFNHDLSTFAPSTNVPVPSEYIVGAGDQLVVQLYGTQNRRLALTVTRDGRVNLPDLGPIDVAGQTFEEVKSEIEARVARQMIGVRASVSMGDTRSIRVFVLGEARSPGSYTISGLGTITSALYAAGGAKREGSLRNVQLKRRGVLVRQFDLYDLLIRGDTKDDAKLLSGDVIFIPPVGPTVSIDGEVRRPAIYEIKGESTVADILQLAGGLTAEADRSNAMLTRIDDRQRRIVVPVELSAGARTEAVRNGDSLRVLRLRPTLDAGILLQGHVYVPGEFAYRPGMRLTDVVHSVDELRPDADQHYLLIRRELPPERRISVLSVDLDAALRAPDSAADVELMPRDRITVFDLASGRDHVIQPLLEELRVQGTAAHPTATVHAAGQVKVPGEYPLEPGMTSRT